MSDIETIKELKRDIKILNARLKSRQDKQHGLERLQQWALDLEKTNRQESEKNAILERFIIGVVESTGRGFDEADDLLTSLYSGSNLLAEEKLNKDIVNGGEMSKSLFVNDSLGLFRGCLNE